MIIHQRRVLEERAIVEVRLKRLKDFMTTATFFSLDDEDRELLTEQVQAMEAYATVLRKRIARFET